MSTFMNYARHRYFAKSHDFGKPWVRPLFLDAILFAVRRTFTLHRPGFRKWCSEVDRLFVGQHDWPRSYTKDTGLDSWVDAYWDRMSPQDAVDSEVDHWN